MFFLFILETGARTGESWMDFKKLQEVFHGEAKLFKLVGYSRFNNESNEEKRYKKAKTPIPGVSWTSYELNEGDFQSWVSEGGWIGLRVPSGLVVVDIDDMKEAKWARQTLVNLRVGHHAIQTVRGWQFIFKHPEGMEIKQTSEYFTWGCFAVDYRIAGKGYIVLPTPNTEGREWVEVSGGLDEVPKWFYPLFSLKSKERPIKIPIDAGMQNTTFNDHGWTLKNKFGVSDTDVEKIMRFMARHICNPAYDSESSLQKTINSVLKSTSDILPGKEKEPSAQGSQNIGTRNYSTDSIPENDDWEPLIPLENANEVPAFPKAFPKWLQDYIDAITTNLEVPSDMPSMCALMTLATANQKKYLAYCATRDWKEPLCGHYASISPPGSMKSQVLGLFMPPIEDHEARLREEAAPKIKRAKSDALTLTKRVEKLRNTYASNPSEELKEEIAALEDDIPKVSALPEIVVADVTPERFSSLLVENNEKIAILSAEGGIWDIIAKNFEKGNGAADIFLKSHDREPHKVRRQTRDGEDLKNPEATIGTLFQPDVMDNWSPMFTKRGGVARILFSWTEGGISEEYKTPNIPQTIKDLFYENLTWLLENEAADELLDMTPEADQVFGVFYREIGRRLKEGDLSDDELQQWGQKLRGRVLRLAGNLHLAKCAGERKISHIMDAHTMRKAIELGEYFIAHVKRTFGKLGDDEAIKDSIYIIKHLKKHAKIGQVDRTDIKNSVKHRRSLKKAEDFDAVLDLLADRNYIKVVKVGKKIVIYINPELEEENEKPKKRPEQTINEETIATTGDVMYI